MLKTKSIRSDFRVTSCVDIPALSQDTISLIEDIWIGENDRCGNNLFNGNIISVCEHSQALITGYLTEYKWFIAQRREPSLFQKLRVRPLAVTGMLVCSEGVVLGCRADNVEQNAGDWELVPSGSIDELAIDNNGGVDLKRAVLTELSEETGLTESDLQSSPESFVIVEDDESHVVDVGMYMQTSLTKNEILKTFEKLENREYHALNILPSNQLLSEKGSSLTPVSFAMLRAIN